MSQADKALYYVSRGMSLPKLDPKNINNFFLVRNSRI